RSAWVDTRASNDTLVDGTLETEHRSPQVADGSEPAHQSVRCLGARYQVGVTEVPYECLRGRWPHKHRVPVRVDEARHQHTAPGVYGCCVFGTFDVAADLRDRVTGHKD